jgi:hypothetical protein
LLPDEPFTVTVKKDGFETTTEELTLAEGENRDIEFKIRRVADSGSVPGTNEDPVTGSFVPK